MIRTALVVLVLLGPAATAQAQKLSEAEVKDGFVAMFNGKDFSGWQFGGGYEVPAPLPKNWKVEDGVIKLSGGGSPHLGSQWDYEDFDMRFEWRALKPNYNSGFYVRSGRKVGANQINLAQKAAGNLMGGAKGGKAVPELQKPVAEWNEWRVLAVGDKLTFWCNGKLAWEVTGFKPARGHLGLQAEGAAMEFRNLRIKEIGYDNLGSLDRWQSDPPGQWKRDGDALTTAGKGKQLETLKKDYKNYVLRLEWQGTKGVLGLRGAAAKQAHVQFGGQAGKGADNPAGQWNYLEVRITDGQATVWQNGATIATLKDAPPSGGVSLHADQPLQVRNVRIREVK